MPRKYHHHFLTNQGGWWCKSPTRIHFRSILDALLDNYCDLYISLKSSCNWGYSRECLYFMKFTFSWISWKSWRLDIKMYQTAPVYSAADYINSQILLKNVLSLTKYSKVFFELPTNLSFSISMIFDRNLWFLCSWSSINTYSKGATKLKRVYQFDSFNLNFNWTFIRNSTRKCKNWSQGVIPEFPSWKKPSKAHLSKSVTRQIVELCFLWFILEI